jgi:hypothetical protein
MCGVYYLTDGLDVIYVEAEAITKYDPPANRQQNLRAGKAGEGIAPSRRDHSHRWLKTTENF